MRLGGFFAKRKGRRMSLPTGVARARIQRVVPDLDESLPVDQEVLDQEADEPYVEKAAVPHRTVRVLFRIRRVEARPLPIDD